LEAVAAGTIRIGERVVNDLEPRKRNVAMVFQNDALYPSMTVADTIGFGLKMRRRCGRCGCQRRGQLRGDAPRHASRP
jgi:ABC-type sugar transport system ATPase subunit